MDPGQGIATPPGDRPTDRRRAWLRVGLISAGLWVVIGPAVAFVSDRLGAPTAAGLLAVLTGPVVLRIVGRRHGLRDSWSWTQAGMFQLGLALLIGSIALYLAVLGGFLGPADSPTG